VFAPAAGPAWLLIASLDVGSMKCQGCGIKVRQSQHIVESVVPLRGHRTLNTALSRAIMLGVGIALMVLVLATMRYSTGVAVGADSRELGRWSGAPTHVGQMPLGAVGQSSILTDTFNYLPLFLYTEPSDEPPTGWLAYLNYYRAMANLPSLAENAEWSDGCFKHARYTVKNDVLEHDEDPGNPWYTSEGQAAAQSSNLMATSIVNATDESAIDGWMQAPFHAVGMLDPALLQTGFGSYREAVGVLQMAAALDVIRGVGSIPPSVTFPIKWPGDGATVSLTSHWNEYPNPLTSCPGYIAPSGLPIILQIGSGGLTPNVTAHSFKRGGVSLDHCVFDETSYANPNSSQQSLGRSILNFRDAIVLIPRQPLTVGETYTVSITVNGQTYAWSFSVSSMASADQPRLFLIIN
jgi:hypothetical protein